MRLRRHKNGWLLLRLFIPVKSINQIYRIISENIPLIWYPLRFHEPRSISEASEDRSEQSVDVRTLSTIILYIQKMPQIAG
jgi:hypothetical protein